MFKEKKYWILAVFIIFLIGFIWWKSAQVDYNKLEPPGPVDQTMPTGQITIRGELTCLPHKNSTGPQTMECVFGLKDDKGIFYGLHDSDPGYKNLSQPTGKRYEVVGTFTPRTGSIYQDIGIIEIQKMTPL